MPEEARLRIEGATQFAHDLRRLSEQVVADDEHGLAGVARQLVPRVQSLMPKVTGRLAASVGVDAQGADVDVTADTEYAGWIEFGGSRGRPRIAAGRFLTPTVAHSGTAIKSNLTSVTKNTIGGFSWSHTST